MDKKSQQIKALAEDFWNKQSFNPTAIDFFSENIAFQTIIGKRVSKQNHLAHSKDWTQAFPDIRIEVTSIEAFGNIVHASFWQTGTFVSPYQDKETQKDTVISTTAFSDKLQQSPPNRRKTEILVDWVFVFDRNKVIKLFGSSDELSFHKQLGLFRANDAHIEQDSLKKHLNNLLPTPLSSREAECVALTFTGLRAKHIAEFLTISYRTIETHLQNAYHKLGCSRQDQCLQMMLENWILPLWHDLAQLLLYKPRNIQDRLK